MKHRLVLFIFLFLATAVGILMFTVREHRPQPAADGVARIVPPTLVPSGAPAPALPFSCLQFLSECMKSTAEPHAVKSVLARYSQGQDGLAGVAIVNLDHQEGERRLRNDEGFSFRQVGWERRTDSVG